MHARHLSATIVCLCFAAAAFAADPPARKPLVRKATGIDQRVPWTTSKIHGTPEPPAPYQTEFAFPKLKFFEPLSMAAVPGTDRLAIAERPGKIFTFANRRDVPEPQLLLDVKRTVYGIVFHPKFAENGFFYVANVENPMMPSADGTRLSRFTVHDREAMTADLDSERVILTWPSGGHNGGCLKFGPDGFLYVSLGDGSGIADELQTGQDVSDLLGSIVRIDVDHPADGREYGIPADNPFVGVAKARPEIFSYGHRQVWKFSFDEQRRLWAGEIGQDLWEMIYWIEKGGNYGWSVQEGTHPFRPERPLGPSPIQRPILEHGHADFRSITGGFVYRGSRLPELQGAYIYGDYDTGRIWSLRVDASQTPPKPTESRELVDTQLRLVEFGKDPAGEIFLVDFAGGQIHQLAPAPKETEPAAPFPTKLSETGLFASTRELKPAPGLIPYSVNSELWSDGATKERYLALPGDSQIEFETVLYPTGAPGAEPGWRFPHDTVLVKTFFLDMETGNPKSRRRLETRILHHKHMPGTEEYGTQFWRGYTYVWNEEQTDAELLASEGLTKNFSIRDEQAPGGMRDLAWRFPSRAECTLCHTMAAKYALGVTTTQMNKDHNYGGTIANQLATLEHLRVFTQPLPKRPEELPRLANYRNTQAPLDARARSYLQSNCAHCHRKWGGGNADFQLLSSLPLSETMTINTRPGQGKFDLTDPRILVPGDPDRSLIYLRMNKLGLGRMPHIASTVVDRDAVEMIRKWIAELPPENR